jgi:hypothetical protein
LDAPTIPTVITVEGRAPMKLIHTLATGSAPTPFGGTRPPADPGPAAIANCAGPPKAFAPPL